MGPNYEVRYRGSAWHWKSFRMRITEEVNDSNELSQAG